MNVLVWLRRDLRVTDNPALHLAAQIGAVFPLFIADPAQVGAGRHWGFVAECLAELRRDLAALGVPLVLRMGETGAVLGQIVRRYGITHIVCAKLPGDALGGAMAEWARREGVVWHWVEGAAAADLPAPQLRGGAGVEAGPIPTAQALRLAADPCPHRQLGGRLQAAALLESFVAARAAGYVGARVRPLQAERATSRLSPYLAQGVISAREVMAALEAAQLARRGTPGAARLTRNFAAFRGQMGARDAIVRSGLAVPDMGGAAPRALAAWSAGETGLPFVDAVMRYVNAAGWASAPLREMLARLALGPLGQDWAAVGHALAAKFTDYDPALLWTSVQGLAQSPARAMNPIALGLRLDPAGQFTRRWVPELRDVPTEVLHMPWRWEGAARLIGRRYPEAVVNIPYSPKHGWRAPKPAKLQWSFCFAALGDGAEDKGPGENVQLDMN